MPPVPEPVARRDTMTRRRHNLVAGLLTVGVSLACGLAASCAGDPQDRAVVSRVIVRLPQYDAQLAMDEERMPGLGEHRTVETEALPAGSTRTYTFTTTWQPNGYTTMTRNKRVTFRAGDTVEVDLASDDPGDRAKVVYVATSVEAVRGMVRMARIGRNDVVFEPGCGDARLAIAAIRAGARRGICVDIDPERVEESRANVAAAGLADRIDVRLGDALDVRDLSEVTVVLLYMGEQFNLLLRPVLWRDLPVGSRVVSHRFSMGDWEPDRTAIVDSAVSGRSVLLLWTVTEAVKVKARQVTSLPNASREGGVRQPAGVLDR